MVIDGFESADCEQECGLAKRHASQPLGDDSTTRIKNEAFDGVVEPSAIRIRYIHLVVPGVDGLEQVCVHVHGAVQEVLPSVDKKTAKSVGGG